MPEIETGFWQEKKRQSERERERERETKRRETKRRDRQERDRVYYCVVVLTVVDLLALFVHLSVLLLPHILNNTGGRSFCCF